MKKRRLPTDIDFLLESVMTETPDEIAARRLTGRSIGRNIMQWKDPGAVGFFVHADEKVVMYSAMRHIDMQDMLERAASTLNFSVAGFNDRYSCNTDKLGNLNFSEIASSDSISLYGLKDTYNDPGIAIRTYLKKYVRYFRAFNIRGTEPDTKEQLTRANVPAGRLWTKERVVSFWNDKYDVMPYIDLISDFMESLHVDKEICLYEFLDTRKIFAYGELDKNFDDNDRLSPEETRKLRRIQHIDPKAKKKLASPEYKKMHLNKAARGFDIAAQANAMMPALEETIKLKNLLVRRQ
jgi:hypothetical protein